MSRLRHSTQRDRPAYDRPVASASEREQRVEEIRQALDLGLGEPELVLHCRIIRLDLRSLEPQPQPGQRCAELMRRVADELALSLDRLLEPLGHVVEGDRDLPLLAGTGDVSARIELAVLDAPRRARERAQRPGERACEHPGETETERERHEPDADYDEYVPAHARADRVDALSDAHGAAAQDRHRGVEKIAAERVAVPRSLLGPAGEGSGDLGPVAVRGQAESGTGGVGDEPPRASTTITRAPRSWPACLTSWRSRAGSPPCAAAAVATTCAWAAACAFTSALTRLERLSTSGISSTIRTSTST